MRTRTAALALTAGLVAGGGAAALFTPGLALAASPTASPAATAAPAAPPSATDRAAARLTAIKDALKRLVSDGTIDQSQADEVASTLTQADLGPGGGRGHGRGGRVSPEAAAKVLGITVDQLRTAERAGQTLTQIAQAHGVSRTALVDGLVAAARTQLADDVKAGRLTQARADTLSSTLADRISARVDEAGRGCGHEDDHGHGGRGSRDHDAPAAPAAPAAPGGAAPSTPATPGAPAPSPSATS